MLWQTEIAVPARYKHHVICQIFALDLQLLHDDDVRLQDIEHGIECPVRTPWLVAKGIANAVDIPGGDANHGGVYFYGGRQRM